LFWNKLLKDSDVGSLPDLVASIERSEKKAEFIYRSVSAFSVFFSRFLSFFFFFLGSQSLHPFGHAAANEVSKLKSNLASLRNILGRNQERR
jgi:hypothetical protein